MNKTMHQIPKIAVRRQFIALIPVFMNVFVMGYAIGWTTHAIYFYSIGTELEVSPNEIALIVSFYEVGRIVFAIPAGFLTDKYGRRKAVIFTSLTHFLSWLLLSFSTSAIPIYISRFAMGISTAMTTATSLITIGEIASPETRGKFTILYVLINLGGALTTSLTSAILPSYYLLSYNITAIAFICMVSTFWMMETPNYLISKSKHDQAKHNLKRIRPGYSEDDISYEFEKLEKYIDEERTRKQRLSWFQFVKTKSIAKPIGLFVLINLFTIVTGFPLIAVYMTVIIPDIGYVSKQYYPLIGRVVFLLPLVATPFYVEKFSRRSIFMVGAAIMGITNAACAVTYFCYSELREDYFVWLFIVCNLLLGLIYNGALLSMVSAMKTELLPQCVKGIGGSLGEVAQALATIILYRMYNFISENFSIYHLYLVLSGNSLILCLLVFFLLPEGRGKFLADIQGEFCNKQSEPVTEKI